MGTMEGLEVTDCEQCPALVDCRSQIVNGTGPEDAALLFVGEGPGANEDEQGEPFVGRSGSVLDDKLRDAGLSRMDVRITNCVRCRPPENRDPTKEELSNCREHLEREIELVNPDVIVTLGKVPSQHLLDRNVAVTSEAGSIANAELGGEIRDVLICVHPAATLYDRSQESTFESAIEKAATMAGSSGGQSSLGEF
ncbi:DNA polymerase [Haladaptatus litoreus]|uniref:Type-4 uracil-DNA glycosylase n=1 Tax=Haladaptatus litoreus TaxID=553468 RepID=A0A1N7BDL1_9EURY|nr:uracil-DNA glycosylase [Haladaptatus litoreus]SIR49316.1 DNA polymerase [Haladaptatus litoreus]